MFYGTCIGPMHVLARSMSFKVKGHDAMVFYSPNIDTSILSVTIFAIFDMHND